ncbi:uncharacterized protein LOC123703945 [Colias croceus]|uniref:uncharacterized protein LOC123703945 n=1 Tax=Colias crocea TaxID=72248 RepID=UPI001E280B53|nr:uncharacterized protein LOC123703945 [Colias croceus]
MDNQSHSNTNLSQSSENAAHIYINNYELPIRYEDTSTVKDEPSLKTLLEKNYETLSKVKRSMSLDDIKEENAEDIIRISSGDDETDFLETISLDSDRLSYHSSDFEFIDEDEAKTCGLYSQNKNINEYKLRPINKNHVIPQGNDYLELFQGRYTPYPRTDMENKCTKSRFPMHVGCNGIGFNMYGMPQNVSDELRNEAAENAKKIRQMYPAENMQKRRRPRRYYR